MNLGSELGFSGGGNQGSAGINYQATNTPVIQSVTPEQTEKAYDEAQSGIAQQQAFVDALKQQHGIQNQSDVFQQQQQLANQLQGVANGQGPNPARAQLATATGNNIASTAAQAAGQRGAGTNVGMIARQAAMAGGNINQQAAGQDATLEAQQQLAGMQALGAQQANMGNLATTQVGQQAGAITGYNQAAQSEQQNLLNSVAQANNATVGMQSNVNNANGNIAGVVAKQQGDLQNGILKGAGMALMAKGGEVAAPPKPKAMYADGGTVVASPSGPKSFAGRFMYGSAPDNTNAGMNGGFANSDSSAPGAPSAETQAGQQVGQDMGKGLKSLFSSSPDGTGGAAASMGGATGGSGGGAVMIAGMAKGGPVVGEMLAAQGKMVPGKAKVAGNSYANDNVPAILSPKEIVLPRSVTMAKDAPEKAKAFVAAILAKNGMPANPDKKPSKKAKKEK